ncbi:MAG TPA: glycosyltransferase family 2 protein [Allosphingosinicella sp.]|jgi:dolichol-phosphate mannosyltransferase
MTYEVALKSAARAGAEIGPPPPLELAVVVPTFKEADNVEALVRRLEAALPGIAWEVVFVDDNSPDGTAGCVRALARQDRRVRCIERVGRRGLASACVEGMLATAAPLIAVIDADLQHDERLLPEMLTRLRAQPELDIVVGSRFVEGGSADGFCDKRAAQSRLAARLSRAVLRDGLSDPMSGFFMLRAELFRAVLPKLSAVGFKLLLDILASAGRPLRFIELPYAFRARASGASKLDPMIAFEYLVMLYDKALGRVVPTRFALFCAIGGIGVAVHFALLTLLFKGLGQSFGAAQTAATVGAMTFNFFLNNALTYRDQQLRGARRLVLGWLSFCLVCGVGAVANIGVATYLFEARHALWTLSALAGVLAGAVWNFALSSRFTWGRY